MKAGIRVGALVSATKELVKFLGYGIYEGDFLIEIEPGFSFPNPRIKLDNSDTVWGCECWWGPEDQIKHEIAWYSEQGAKIEEVRLEGRDNTPPKAAE